MVDLRVFKTLVSGKIQRGGMGFDEIVSITLSMRRRRPLKQAFNASAEDALGCVLSGLVEQSSDRRFINAHEVLPNLDKLVINPIAAYV